jgi:hypothetical protein
MATVNTIDGIKYGFRVLGYGVAVFFLALIVMAVGGFVARSSPIVGGILAVIGFLILLAGIFGTLYKVIADGVSAGVEDAGEFPRPDGVRERRTGRPGHQDAGPRDEQGDAGVAPESGRTVDDDGAVGPSSSTARPV